MDKTILQIENVTKKYDLTEALSGVNLTLNEGKVLGLLGPNGSGKTTLLKIIMGLIKPDTGNITIYGEKIGKKTKKIISYLPDAYHLYDNLTIADSINLYKDFYEDFNLKKCENLMDFMKIPKKGYADKLSKGMKERLLLTLTLSREAKIYVLDEPIEGVDQIAKDMILTSIINSIDVGKTMIITTHQVSDLENLFDEIAFLNDGKIEYQDDAERIRNKNNMTIAEFYREYFG